MSDDSSDSDIQDDSVYYPGDKSAWSQMTNWERLLWLLRAPIRTCICFTNVTVFFFAYLGFMLPILWARTVWPRLYWFCEGKLYRWLQAFIGYWGYTAGYDVYEYGDDMSELCEERTLILCNHQSTADVPTLMAVLQSKGVASRKVMWLMDVMFRWTTFGIVGAMHGDYFIRQGRATRERELLRFKEHLCKVFWDRDRRWIIIFPEGGFYYKRIESSQRYGRENGYPFLRYTTLPRLGATKAILEQVGPRDDEEREDYQSKHRTGKLKLIKDTVGAIRERKYVKETRPPIKFVVDMTIAYPHGMPLSLATLLLGTREKCDIAVNYRIFKADEVPFHDEEKLRDWMYKVYQEKDDLLASYYACGEFVKGEEGTRVYFPWWKIISQYFFWLFAFYFQYRFYSWLILWPFKSLGFFA
ncbi:hypothetical protein AB6A40_004459 [Gnathostoma spinigerum]|uniref:Phospholipid/glycerol acyltransferase domain-containing protein n=1 Tax=Gnathostoma spinigerum TaxID=75299 RepID=A0ABD6ECJ5_9BILA